MSDSGPVSECVNCALVLDRLEELEELEELELGPLAVFLIPGGFFLALGIRWSLLLLHKWGREAHSSALLAAGLPPAPAPSCTARPLPWEGGVKILLTALTASLTLALPAQAPSTSLLISLYLFFLLSGLVDVLVFYCGYTVLPEGVQSFILSLAFCMEAVIFRALAPTTSSHLTDLLILVILSCALASILEVVFDNKLVKFCRTFFTTLQASWLVHLGLLPASPLSPSWAALLFSWHLAALFTLYLLLLLTCSYCSRVTLPGPLLPSPSGSASQLVPCKFLALPPGPFLPHGVPSVKSRGSLSPTVVDMEPWDRVHYSTFGKLPP